MEAKSRVALRLRLHSGLHSLPLERVHYLAGYATLSGEPEDYFAGWLALHGEQVPVFDLNRVVCDEPTAENFGARIVVIETDAGASVRHIGLLAPELTDTIAANDEAATPIHLDSYLPMLYPLIPALPVESA